MSISAKLELLKIFTNMIAGKDSMSKADVILHKRQTSAKSPKIQKVANSLPRAALTKNRDVYVGGRYYDEKPDLAVISIHWYARMIKNSKNGGLLPWTIIVGSLTGALASVSMIGLLCGNLGLAFGFGIATGAMAFLASPVFTTMAIFKSRVRRAHAVELANIKKILSEKFDGVEITDEDYLRKKDLHDFLLGKSIQLDVLAYTDSDEPRSGSVHMKIDSRVDDYTISHRISPPQKVVVKKQEVEVPDVKAWSAQLPESVTSDEEFDLLLCSILAKAQMAYALNLSVEFQHSVERVLDVTMKTAELYGSFLGLARKPESEKQARETAFSTLVSVDEELDIMLDSEESNVLDQLEAQKQFLEEVRKG